MESQSQKQVEYIPDEYINTEMSHKVIIIGNCGVGKTCLSLKVKKKEYEEDIIPTVGFEHFSLNFKYQKKGIKWSIWDNSGNEQYKQLISSFYGNAGLAIIVYAINNKASFESVIEWWQEYKSYAAADCKLFLIGNKSDLESEREVTIDEAKKLKEEYEIDLFLETSAKNGNNCWEVFENAVKILTDASEITENKEGKSAEENKIESSKSEQNNESGKTQEKSAFRMFFHNLKEDAKKQYGELKVKIDSSIEKIRLAEEQKKKEEEERKRKEEEEQKKKEEEDKKNGIVPTPPAQQKSAFRMFFHNIKEDAKKQYTKLFDKTSDNESPKQEGESESKNNKEISNDKDNKDEKDDVTKG